MSPRAATLALQPCGHFATLTRDGEPACSICSDRAASARIAESARSGLDPTQRPPADAPGTGAAAGWPMARKLLGEQPTAGVYDLPDSLYHADPLRAYGTESVSASSARMLLPPSTPLHYRWAMDHPDDRRTPAMIFGKAVHAVALETGDLAPFDGASWTSKAAEQFLAEHPDHGDTVPILERDVPRALAMARALRTHSVARLGLTGGAAEQAMFVQHPSGVWMRGKVDYLAAARGDRLIITDIKTTECADPVKFGRSVADYAYHRQADWYAWQARMLNLAHDVTVIFAAVESKAPHAVAVHEIDTGDLRRARALNEAAIVRFAECLESGRWPGYPEHINRITLPGWVERAEEEALIDARHHDEGDQAA